jgi:uncharacterized protein (UPF0128 family)
MHVEFYNRRAAAELGKALRNLGVDFVIKQTKSMTGKPMLKYNIDTPVDNRELLQQIKQLVDASGGIKKS